MTPEGTVLGCLVLSTPESRRYTRLYSEGYRRREVQEIIEREGALAKLPRLTFPFNTMEKVDYGNHLVGSYDSDRQAAFDFSVCGKNVEYFKSFVPSRALQLSGFRIGEATEDNLTKKCIQHLLAINSNPSPEERHKAYLDLAFDKVFTRITERFFLNLELTSRSPKFVLMTRDIPVYFTGFADDESVYLMWSNEENMDDRLREEYGERFCYYRMRPFTNGMCVIQPMYLAKKVVAWLKYFQSDRLKFMNALETHLLRRFITEQDSVGAVL